jgi:quercetin dioxygenase-like cupin family protein
MADLAKRVPFVGELPPGPEYKQLLDLENSISMRSGIVSLKPGEACGAHSTRDHEEIILCLAGRGEVETAALGRRPIQAGQFAYNPPHMEHNVHNTGTELLRYVYVVAPARGA